MKRGPYSCQLCGKVEFGHTKASHESDIENTFSLAREDVGELLKGFAFSAQGKYALSPEEYLQLRHAPPARAPGKSWEAFSEKKIFSTANYTALVACF